MKNKRTIVITGTSRGLGLEFCRQYLQAGNTVFAVARDVGEKTALGHLKGDFSDRLHLIRGDVARAEDRAAIVVAVAAKTDRLDLLLNNAGIYRDQEADDFTGVTETGLTESFATNAIAPTLLTQAFLPLLTKTPNAKVANVSSLMGSISDNSSGGSYAYRMSKSALNMFAKCLSCEFPELTVLALHPGWVATDMGTSAAPTKIDRSVAGLVRVIDGATVEKSGSFIDFEGNVLPW